MDLDDQRRTIRRNSDTPAAAAPRPPRNRRCGRHLRWCSNGPRAPFVAIISNRFARSGLYRRARRGLRPGLRLLHDLREVEEESVFVAARVGLEADREAARGEA